MMASNAAQAARIGVVLALLFDPLRADAQSATSDLHDLIDTTASAISTETTRATDAPRRGLALPRAVIPTTKSRLLAQSTSSRSTSRRSCGEKIFIGLAIGAGTGVAYAALVDGKVDEPGKFTLAATTAFGLIGAAVGSSF